jgi:ribokinase
MKQTAVVVVGSFVQDLSFKTEQLPRAGETRIGTFVTGPGGKGFNQAIACHRQGVATAFIGACGQDLFADSLKEFIAAEKVTAALDVHPEHSTGTAAILVDHSGQNCIVVALGANLSLTSSFVDAQAGHFKGAKVVLVQAECNLAATEAALRQGRTHGATTIFNPAPINKEVSLELLRSADILTPNETEFQFLMQHLFGKKVPTNPLEIPPQELCEAAKLLGAKTVVITLGAQGAFVAHAPGVATDEEPFYLVPPLSAHAIDTTGAGDAFSGGLAAGLIRHPNSLREAARYATAVASLSTERTGTAPAMPTEAEVVARLKRG